VRSPKTRTITVGFSLMAVCYPPWEWSNWMLRKTPGGCLCLGPMRLRLQRETAQRSIRQRKAR